MDACCTRPLAARWLRATGTRRHDFFNFLFLLRDKLTQHVTIDRSESFPGLSPLRSSAPFFFSPDAQFLTTLLNVLKVKFRQSEGYSVMDQLVH